MKYCWICVEFVRRIYTDLKKHCDTKSWLQTGTISHLDYLEYITYLYSESLLHFNAIVDKAQVLTISGLIGLWRKKQKVIFLKIMKIN